jgi:L-fuculose-phosphate aldolase
MVDSMPLRAQREAVSELGRSMVEQGLTKGVGGNLSERGDDGRIAISPSGIPYDRITPDMVPVVDADGERVAGDCEPSSETPMHTMIYERRPAVGAVVHTHSPYATTFASLGQPIPPTHYLVSYVGDKIPVTGYEQPATEALGREATEAIGEEYNACLLQNHGVIAVGDSAEDALETALMVEFCARIHYQATNVRDPIEIDRENIATLVEDIEEYRKLRRD